MLLKLRVGGGGGTKEKEKKIVFLARAFDYFFFNKNWFGKYF